MLRVQRGRPRVAGLDACGPGRAFGATQNGHSFVSGHLPETDTRLREAKRRAAELETELQAVASQLREAKLSAEAANRSKDEFLANVSHEIRTPMNAILGMTELVLDPPLAEPQRRSLLSVRSAACGLLDIINDLID